MTFSSLCCLSILLVSCGPKSLTFHDLKLLRKGMPVDSVSQMLPIERTRTYTVSGKQDYLVHSYPLLIAQVTQTSSYGGGYGGFGGGYSAPMTTSTTYDYTNVFYLIYRGGRLRYWGMMNEIQKSEDLEIQENAKHFFTQLSTTE